MKKKKETSISISVCESFVCVCVVYMSTTLEHVSPTFLHVIKAWQAKESSRSSPQAKEKESCKGRAALASGAGDQVAGTWPMIVSNWDKIWWRVTTQLVLHLGFVKVQKPIWSCFDTLFGLCKVFAGGTHRGAGCSKASIVKERANLTCCHIVQVARKNCSIWVWKLRMSTISSTSRRV